MHTQIKVVGLNHTTSPVEIRERVHFSNSSVPKALKKLRESAGITEAVILSTCNRMEVYFITSSPPQDTQKIKDFLSSFHQIELDLFENSLYDHCIPEVIDHLFKVTSGVDSMVIGENQILSQVKGAYKKAFQTGCTGKILNRLFQTSFEVAKLVRAKTGINKGSISVGSVAVDLMEKNLGKLSCRRAMVLGAGKISSLVVKHLISRGIKSIIVSNRSFDKAKRLAKEYKGEAIHFENYLEYVSQVDILISSTSAPHILIKKDDILRAMRKRGGKPLFLIDLAIPRDIDSEVKHIPDIFSYNIDHLKQVVDDNFHERKQKLPQAKKIVQDRVSEFMSYLKAREAIPTIKKLSKRAEWIRKRELKKSLSKLNSLPPGQREEVEYLTKRIISNIFDTPKRKLKEKLTNGDGKSHLKVVEDIFELNQIK